VSPVVHSGRRLREECKFGLHVISRNGEVLHMRGKLHPKIILQRL
jgi:hypothetical protein